MPSKTVIICPQCGQASERTNSDINRAKKLGAPLYCSRACSGLARCLSLTPLMKRAEKAAYDRAYRSRNMERLKAEKAAYYQLTRDPEKERVKRKLTMARHVAYCQRPEYRERKREYDKVYRATQDYGDFADAFLALQELDAEVSARASWLERRAQNGNMNKPQQRKRDYARQTGRPLRR